MLLLGCDPAAARVAPLLKQVLAGDPSVDHTSPVATRLGVDRSVRGADEPPARGNFVSKALTLTRHVEDFFLRCGQYLRVVGVRVLSLQPVRNLHHEPP